MPAPTLPEAQDKAILKEVEIEELRYLYGLELMGMEGNAGFMARFTTRAMLGEHTAHKQDKKLREERMRHFLEALRHFYQTMRNAALLDIQAVEIALPKAVTVVNDVIRHLASAPDTGNKAVDERKKEALEQAKEEKKRLNKLKNEKLPRLKNKLEQKPPAEIQEIENIREEIQEEAKQNRVLGRIYNAARNAGKYTAKGMYGAAYLTAQLLKAKFMRTPAKYRDFTPERPAKTLAPLREAAQAAAMGHVPFMKAPDGYNGAETPVVHEDVNEDALEDEGPGPTGP